MRRGLGECSGRSFVMMGRYPRAVDVYQQAYDLTKGEDVSALTGLAEALVLTDEASRTDVPASSSRPRWRSRRANPARCGTAAAALSAGKLDVARDRMQALLDQDPPESVRSVLQAQIADINAQLGSGATPAQPAAPVRNVAVDVAVSMAPAIAAQVKSPLTLFVLARTVGAGAPLAVKRLTSEQLPTTVTLSDADAMLAGRGLSSVPKVQVVARLSKSGTPQAQPGDFYGEAEYVVQPGTGSVTIVIDRVAP